MVAMLSRKPKGRRGGSRAGDVHSKGVGIEAVGLSPSRQIC